jgi:Undecaprenyl-phosphate glucose phosphotransferase
MSRRERPGLMKRAQLAFMTALVLADLFSVWAGFYAAHRVLVANPELRMGRFLDSWQLPALYTVVMGSIYFAQRMYQRRRPITHLDEFFKITVYNVFATLLTVALLTLLLRDFNMQRSFVLLGAGLVILTDTLLRTIHAQLQWAAQARGVGDDRIILIGSGEIGQMLLQKMRQNPKLGYQVVGVINGGKDDRWLTGNDVPVLGSLVDIPFFIEGQKVDEVIIGMPESSQQELVNIISMCEREKVGIRVFPDVFQFMASEVTIRDVALQGWKLTVKRIMDVIISAIGLVLCSPFLLLTAILIKLDSPGPVFYTQERMGLDARPFRIIKFRSMRVDAEKAGPGWTTPDDPRKTKLGAFIRRFNIDELPQLVNVLVGDMSLVGPRPERPVYVEQFRQIIPRYMDRHREKAGLTGWAQVNGMRGDTSIVERTKYDLWYIENWSIGLDLNILIRTVLQTIFGTNRNAY